MPPEGARASPARRWILDTAALLNGTWDRDAAVAIVPPRVAAELGPGGRDHARFLALQAAGLRLRSPTAAALENVAAAARRLGESGLSAADLEVAALAADLRDAGEDAVTVTDDYALQNLLKHLRLPYAPARMKGISEVRRYALRCSGCGRWWPPEGPVSADGECPVCGAPVRRKRAREP